MLVTNDDGIGSEGLYWLAAAAAEAGFDVVVAAPDGEASGSGTAVKAVWEGGRVAIERRELPAPATGIPAWALKGTPAFIAAAAASGAFGFRPRYVLSGINRGENTGQALLGSGTVGAALVATGHGVTAAAFSLDVEAAAPTREWATAALVARQVLSELAGLPAGTALNVNVPNVPRDRLRGIRRATLAAFSVVAGVPAELTGGWLHLAPAVSDLADPRGDVAVLAAGYASVTPLQALCEPAAVALPWPSPDGVSPADGASRAGRPGAS